MTKKLLVEESEESDYESSESEVVIEKPKVDKPKRVQTEKQKEAFVKARAVLLAKTAAKKAEKEEEQRIKDELKTKVKAKKDKKKQKQIKALKEMSEESSEEEVIVKKKPKKKIVYMEGSDDESRKPVINIYNHGKEESKPVEKVVRKARGVFL
jgi:hypothetical protein